MCVVWNNVGNYFLSVNIFVTVIVTHAIVEALRTTTFALPSRVLISLFYHSSLLTAIQGGAEVR